MSDKRNPYKVVLTIAGSDSGGCAGIQADIKSISAQGVYAASAITAITAQNTQGVQSTFSIPTSKIASQIESVLTDINVHAIKIGMLHSSEVIETVKKVLERYRNIPIVIDPVMVATSGDPLLAESAVETLKLFLPTAVLITPNIPEAKILLGKNITQQNREYAAYEMGKHFKTSVLLKGGHIEHDHTLIDYLYLHNKHDVLSIPHPFIATKNTHGTGCSLSASIASNLALGYTLKDAVLKAIDYIHAAILAGKNKILGKGNGPIDHFYKIN